MEMYLWLYPIGIFVWYCLANSVGDVLFPLKPNEPRDTMNHLTKSGIKVFYGSLFIMLGIQFLGLKFLIGALAVIVIYWLVKTKLKLRKRAKVIDRLTPHEQRKLHFKSKKGLPYEKVIEQIFNERKTAGDFMPDLKVPTAKEVVEMVLMDKLKGLDKEEE